jgi:hypothetical protein
MDSITFQRLKDIETRFGEVEAQMSDPSVAQDPPAYQRSRRSSNGTGLTRPPSGS